MAVSMPSSNTFAVDKNEKARVVKSGNYFEKYEHKDQHYSTMTR